GSDRSTALGRAGRPYRRSRYRGGRSDRLWIWGGGVRNLLPGNPASSEGADSGAVGYDSPGNLVVVFQIEYTSACPSYRCYFRQGKLLNRPTSQLPKRLAIAAGGLTSLTGVVVLFGWTLDIVSLKEFARGGT